MGIDQWDGDEWGAVAATFVGIIALFGPQIRAWVFRPRFKLRIENQVPHRRRARVLFPDRHASNRIQLFYRMEVKNVGRTTAEAVIGRLVEIRRGDGKPDGLFDPIDLRWVGRSTATVTLLPGQSEFLDILVVDSILGHATSDEFTFQPLAFDPTPRGTATNFLFRGQQLTVVIGASNTKSSAIEIVLPPNEPATLDNFSLVKSRTIARLGEPEDSWRYLFAFDPAMNGGTDAVHDEDGTPLAAIIGPEPRKVRPTTVGPPLASTAGPTIISTASSSLPYVPNSPSVNPTVGSMPTPPPKRKQAEDDDE